MHPIIIVIIRIIIRRAKTQKNRSTSLNDLTPEEREAYLQDLLDNMGSYDEDFY